MTLKDYYKLLQIEISATETDIKKSFRNLALQLHPDRNKDIDAHSRFIEVNEAYQILSDRDKRAKYDALYRRQQLKKAANRRSSEADFGDVAEWAEQGRSVGRKYAEYPFSDFVRDSYINWGTNGLLEGIFDGLGNIIEATGDALDNILDQD